MIPILIIAFLAGVLLSAPWWGASSLRVEVAFFWAPILGASLGALGLVDFVRSLNPRSARRLFLGFLASWFVVLGAVLTVGFAVAAIESRELIWYFASLFSFGVFCFGIFTFTRMPYDISYASDAFELSFLTGHTVWHGMPWNGIGLSALSWPPPPTTPVSGFSSGMSKRNGNVVTEERSDGRRRSTGTGIGPRNKSCSRRRCNGESCRGRSYVVPFAR